MAKKTKPARAPRRIGFGRREKLVVIGALGLIAIGALHFLVFKPRADALAQERRTFDEVVESYRSMQGQSYERDRIQAYQRATEEFRQSLLQIVARERFSFSSFLELPDAVAQGFRDRVRHLSAKWLDYQSTRATDATDLVFIRQQDITNPRIATALRQGLYLWNIPTALPAGVDRPTIIDTLRDARGRYRMIQVVRSDPGPHQNDFNSQLRQLGIPIELLGADHITDVNPLSWEPYRLVRGGVELAQTDTLVPVAPPGIPLEQARATGQQSQSLGQWQSLRLPVPLDAFCALNHINLLVEGARPENLSDGPTLLERAESNPGSLSADEQQRLQSYMEFARVMREGNPQTLEPGLEELLDVHYDSQLVFYNYGLDHVDRLIDMAIDEGLTRVLQVRLYKQVDLPPPPDPWTPPPPPDPNAAQAAAPSGAAGPIAMTGAEFDPFSGEAPGSIFEQQQAQPVQPAAPAVEGFAFVMPIYIQVTGDYSRVMQFFLRLSTGDNFYTVEEISLTTQRGGLPEGHVVADFWVLAPLWVKSIPAETGQAAQ